MSLKFPLPDNIAKLVDKSQREALGIKTKEEVIQESEIRLEKDLHKQIGNLLRLRGIEFFHSRTDKRTTRSVGEPDFLFAVIVRGQPIKEDPTNRFVQPLACALEVKLPGKILTPEQAKMFERMTTYPNAWMCRKVSSIDDVLKVLKQLGL